jgi:hypothetical protein
MELLVRAMQGTQSITERGMHVFAGGREARAPATAHDSDLHGAGTGEQRATSGNGGGPEPQPAQKEAATMDTTIGYESRRDRDLRDDTLKLVRYKVLFVKREYEVAFPEEEDLVYDNMESSAFAAWKVAQFVQKMHNDGVKVPDRWKGRYPPKDCVRDGLVKSLPEDDKKYLRVYYEVLERYPREKFRHDEQHIRVLEQIRDRMPDRGGDGDNGDSASGGDVQSASGGGQSASGGGGAWRVE